jgi:phosphate transport system substrate-binding protein
MQTFMKLRNITREYRCSIQTLAVVLAIFILTLSMKSQGTSTFREYQPGPKLSGVIRSWGSDQMGPLMKLWESGFHKYHPDVCFSDTLKGTATAQFGLHEWVADLAVSTRKIYPYEFYGVYRRSLLYPVEIAVAGGSYNVQHKSAALAIFVNRANPLSRLTMKQLDGIYGAHRTGGWQDLNWHTEIARNADQDIRTWGQLGLKGEWPDKPIHVYGPPGIYPGGISFFQSRVMGGADSWNESLLEYDDRAKMMEALSKDRYGIGYTSLNYQTPQTKALALGESDGGPFVELSRASATDRTYPLVRTAYIYFAPDHPDGSPANVDPKIKEFLLYILSREGQQEVVREGDYLPLTPAMASEQIRKLEVQDQIKPAEAGGQ